MKISVGEDSVTLTGKTKGSDIPRDPMGIPYGYELARSVSFTLDIDKAPTTDVWGNTDYTEKNSRMFQVITEMGWSAGKVADMLAKKVNSEDDFSATVSRAPDGSATIRFAHK
jgi:hypothetical protein